MASACEAIHLFNANTAKMEPRKNGRQEPEESSAFLKKSAQKTFYSPGL